MWKWSNWMKFRTQDQEPPAEFSVRQLAVLLHAGASPELAWREVAVLSGPSSTPHQIRIARGEGIPLARAIEMVTQASSADWRAVGAAWALVRDSGSAMGPALDALASAMRDQEITTREIRAELAAPRATLRLVGILPAVALAGSALAGGDSLRFLFSTAPGLTSLGLGIGLLAGAWWWMSLITTRVQDTQAPPSFLLDFFALSVQGGGSPQRALVTTQEVLQRYGLIPGDEADIHNLIDVSRRAGIPLALLARSRAEFDRSSSRIRARQAVAQMSVTLVLPLGLLVLPAFVLLAVLPMAWGIWNQAGLS